MADTEVTQSLVGKLQRHITAHLTILRLRNETRNR